MGNCLGTVMSHIMHSSENFSMYISLIAFLTCMILCLCCMLAFGIGLGYNYSYINFKSNHKYVMAQYKKTRPTDYYGPGYFRPTTKLTRRKPKLVQRVSEPVVFENINEYPVDTPSENLGEYLRVDNPHFLVPTKVREDPLQRLYFTALKTIPTTRFALLKDKNDSLTASTPGLSVKNETEATVLFYKSSNQSHVNTTEELSGQEISVDITKSTNADNSSIAQTTMSMKQLFNFITFLQEKQKKFKVQVITL